MEQLTTTENQLVSTHRKEELFHINLLINPSFPLSDFIIEVWSESISELAPNISNSILKKIIDKYKKNQLDWNHRLGIQNIFLGYIDYLNCYIKYYQDEQQLISDRGCPNEGKHSEYKDLQDKIITISKELHNFSKPTIRQTNFG